MMGSSTVTKSAPGRRLLVINVGSGNVTPPTPCRAFFVGGAGDVVVIAADDTASVTLTCAAGAIIPVEVKTFVQTGTTATNIVAIF